MPEYSVRDQLRLSNTLLSYFSLMIAGIGLIIWVLSLFTFIPQNIIIISILFLAFGTLIWEIIFIKRIRYLNGFYSPAIFFSFFGVIPMIPFLLSINGIGSVDVSNPIVLFLMSLGSADLFVLVFFFMREMNKFYFTTDILRLFLRFFSNKEKETKIGSNELSEKLGLTQKLTELYIYQLIEYDPEIGELNSLDYTFTSSNNTVSILQKIILETENSSQEKLIKSLNATNY